jgi:phenylacetate-CoA ligase
MTVRVEARPQSASPEDRAGLGLRLSRSIKEGIGVTAEVDVLEPQTIERSAGKARRVIDTRVRR